MAGNQDDFFHWFLMVQWFGVMGYQGMRMMGEKSIGGGWGGFKGTSKEM